MQGDADFKDINMSFPQGMEDNDWGVDIPKGKVCKLKKSLYGLKQTGFIWWQTLSTCLRDHGFKQCDAEPCQWIYNQDGKYAVIILHVDDGLIISNDHVWLKEHMASISKVLKHAVNEEPADWYLGLKMKQEITDNTLNAVVLSQPAYISQLCTSNGIAEGTKILSAPCTDNKCQREIVLIWKIDQVQYY